MVHSALHNELVKWLTFGNGARKDEGGCSMFWNTEYHWLLSVSDGVKRISKGTGTGEWTCSDSPIQMWRGKLKIFLNTKYDFSSWPSARCTETSNKKLWGIICWGKHVAIVAITTRRLELLWHMNGSKASVSFEKKEKERRVEMEHCSQPDRNVKTDLRKKIKKKAQAFTVN